MTAADQSPGGSGAVLLVEEGGVGGVADYTAELAGALARAGWSIEVATARDHSYPAQPGVRVHGLFPYVRGRGALARVIRRFRLSRPLTGLTHLAATAPLLRIARRCELVHVQGGEWPPLGALQALLVRSARRPLVWTPHNTFDRGNHAYARARTLIERCAEGLVLHSEHDRDGLLPMSAAKAVVIPHGEYGTLGRRRAGDESPAPAPGSAQSGEQDLVVLMFGQLRPDKGVSDLLEAAAEVAGLRVWLVGEDKGALAQAEGLLSDVRLADRVVVREGFVPFEDTQEVFAAADVVALPYHQASASGVLMLAYGYSRPVIAYPVGGLPEYVIDGETGWLCARADPAALAETLVTVRNAGRSRWRACGAAARELADERYSWADVAERTSAVYERILGRRGAMRTPDRAKGRQRPGLINDRRASGR